MKLTGLDSAEIPRYTYDEKNNSNRVTIVAGDLNGITDSIKAGLKDLNINIAPQENNAAIQIQRIEVPVIVEKVQIVEVPVIVKEIEIKEIEKQVVVYKVIEIEKPVIVTQFEKIEVPVVTGQKDVQIVYVDKLNYKLLFIMQLITLGLLVVSKYIK